MTQDLIERALAGEQAAVQELHEAHYPAVLRLAFLLLQDLQDAEDATQEAFIYAFDHLERYDAQRGAFSTWLKVIVTSRCRDLQRRNRIQWLSLHSLTELGREPEDETDAHRPEVALELVGVQQEVWRALKQVPRKSREALILRYFGGLAYDELAQALNCSVNTAKSRVVYGHQALARLIESERQQSIGADLARAQDE